MLESMQSVFLSFSRHLRTLTLFQVQSLKQKAKSIFITVYNNVAHLLIIYGALITERKFLASENGPQFWILCTN